MGLRLTVVVVVAALTAVAGTGAATGTGFTAADKTADQEVSGIAAADSTVDQEVLLGLGMGKPDYQLGSFGRQVEFSLRYWTGERVGEGRECSSVGPENVVLVLTLPDGVSVISESDGRGEFDSAANTLTWELGTLDPDEHCRGSGIDVLVDVGSSIPDGTPLETTATINTTTPGDDPSDNEANTTFQGGMLPMEVFFTDVDVEVECRGDDNDRDSIDDVGGGVSCTDVDEPGIFSPDGPFVPAVGDATAVGPQAGKVGELKGPGGGVINAGPLWLRASADGGWVCEIFSLGPPYCEGLGIGPDASAQADLEVRNPNPFEVPLRLRIDGYGHVACSNNTLGFPGEAGVEDSVAIVDCGGFDEPAKLENGEFHLDCDGTTGECQRRIIGTQDDIDDTVSSDLVLVSANDDQRIRLSLEGDASGDSEVFFGDFTLIRSGYGRSNAIVGASLTLAGEPLPAFGNTLRVTARSPVDLIVTDQEGRRVGVDPDVEPPNLTDMGIDEDVPLDARLSNRTLAEIPGGQYSGPDSEPEVATIALAEPGAYDLQVLGTGDGPFTVTVETLDVNGNVLDSQTITGEATSEMVLSEEIQLQDDGSLGGTNQPPVADSGGPYDVDEGEMAQLDATNSTDPNGDDLTFAWDLDGDGTTDSNESRPVFDAAELDGPTTVAGSLTVCDPSDACDIDTVTVTVENVAPTLEVAVDDPVDEGSPLNLTATITDLGLADTHTLVIEWGDGETDTVAVDEHAAVGTVTVEHTFLDDEDYPVAVTVTDDDGDADDVAVTATVENVPPTVSATGDAIDEGQTATVSATFTDPGILDTHTAEIDWGDGTTGAVAVDQGAGEGSIEASHAYGDDGEYTVTVRVTDDDGGTGEDTVVVAVANLAPEAALDTSDAIALPSGAEAFLGLVDAAQSHRAEATDPGSDDLTFAWSMGNETTYFNDGTGPDTDLSPGGTFPFTATDTAGVTFAEPGVHEVNVTVRDDDGGRDEAGLPKLATGDADDVRGQGFWRQQYSDRGRAHYSDAELEAFLAIANYASGVFSEQTEASTSDAAHDALSPSGPGMREKAEAQALAAWLNFAAGGVGWTEQIDTDGDGEADRAFHDIIGEVEAIIADPDASEADLERAKDLAEAINIDGGDTNEGPAGDSNNDGAKGKGKQE